MKRIIEQLVNRRDSYCLQGSKAIEEILEVVSTYTFLLRKGYLPEQALEKTRELKPHLAEYVDEAKEQFHAVS